MRILHLDSGREMRGGQWQALRLMEDRPSQISVLPVVDGASGACLGLLRLHDIYRADIGRAGVRV